MKTTVITFEKNKYLLDQTIEIIEPKNEIKILVGIGMLNSKDELSQNFPLDILLIIESLKVIKEKLDEQNKQLYITVWFGDKNAEILLKEKDKFTEENKKIWESTKEIYKKKINKIFVNSGLFDLNKIDYIYGTDLYNNKEYRAYCENLSKTTKFGDDITSYSKEQLYFMHYFKNKLGYNLRLSWTKKNKSNKKTNNRDEEGIDRQYEETFNEKPMTSVYFINGLKLDKKGYLVTAVPYSYFPSENNQRIPFDSNITLEQIQDFLDSLKEKHYKKFEDLYASGKAEGESSAEYILHKIIDLLK